MDMAGMIVEGEGLVALMKLAFAAPLHSCLSPPMGGGRSAGENRLIGVEKGMNFSEKWAFAREWVEKSGCAQTLHLTQLWRGVKAQCPRRPHA